MTCSRTWIAALATTSLGASLLYGAMAPAASAQDDGGSAWSDAVARASDEAIAGIETAGPIPTVAATEGERWPALPPGAAIMPRGTVLSGDDPLVLIPAFKDVDGIDVRVRELSAARPDTAVVFEGTAVRGWFTVGASLKSGAEYAVDVRKPSGDWAGVGSFNVSASGAAGPVASVGDISVSEVTGRVSHAWESPTVPGPGGGSGVGFTWRSGAQASPGLPEGWRLNASAGSPWLALEESPVDVAAVDQPMAPAVQRQGTRIRVDFAYPADEARLVDRFVVEGRKGKGKWRVLATRGGAFAAPDVDAVIRDRGVTRVRVGVRVEGTTYYGPSARVQRKARPITSVPAERDLPGAGSGSLATPGDQPSVVRLVGWDGSRLTFVRNPLGVYEQTGGAVAGFRNGLVWIADGEWEFAALDGTVTRFVDGLAVSVTTNGVTGATMTWSRDGRLTRFANEVGRSITLRYSGDSACPSWPGFAAAPAGLICAVEYPGGTRSEIGYVDAGDSAQIALIKDPGNSGATLGWDDRGRLVSIRSALVTRVTTVDPSVAGVIDAVTYDSQGRAATLIAAPGEVGGPFMTTTIDFPRVTEADLRDWAASGSEQDAARVTVRATGGSYDLSRAKLLDPITWQVVRVTAPYGLNTSVDRDRASGQLASAIDPVGRTTTYTYDEIGQVTTVRGPAVAGEQASQSATTYDTERVSGRDRALSGLRAQVYSADDYAGQVTAEFWEADYSRGGLSYRWSGRGTKFSAQASGVWTPGDRDDAAGARDGWDVIVTASGGSDVSLVVGGVICPATGAVCRVPALGSGPKSVTVQIADAPSDGWFSVVAAPAGKTPDRIPFDDVRPGFGLTTVSTSNDDLPGGTDVTRTEYSFADPATGQLTSVKALGGLVTEMSYEESTGGNGSWGRLLTRTTPGELTQTTSYWPDRASVSLPGECGSGTVDVSGQPRTITRQDGTTLTTYYDLQGLPRAVVSRGGSITQVACTTYRADGALLSTANYIDGALFESATYEQAIGGDPRVARVTYTHGPASPSAGESRSSTSTIDLLGRDVLSVDIAGTTTQTTYDAVGNVTGVTTTPPEGARTAAHRVDYAYDAQSSLLASVSVNGVRAADITRDGLGRTSSIAYAGGTTVGRGFAADGRIDSLTITTDGGSVTRVVDEFSITPAGRITSRSTVASGSQPSRVEVGYVYDSAARLDRAVYSGDASATFEYEHDPRQAAACGSAYAAGRDGQRTGGTRDGIDYISCYDAGGRQVSTTDPLVAGADGTSTLSYDGLGRVTNLSGPRALAAQWSWGTQVTRLDEIAGDGSGLVSTRWESFGGVVLDKTVVTDAGPSTVREAGVFLLGIEGDSVVGTSAITYALPGGASVLTAPGTSATLTLPGVDGAALLRVDVPELGSGEGAAPGAAVGLVGAYGPYGEPLETPDIAEASPIPTMGWQTAAGHETLPGTSSIVMMGARPYHPALGAFLAADPAIDSGDNLYSYTGGDPVNSHDLSGQEEQSPAVMTGIATAASLLFTFGMGFLQGKMAALGRDFGARMAKRFAMGGLAVSAVAGGVTAYLATKGQSADVWIAVGAAVGAAAIGTVAGGLGAKWGFAKTTRMLEAREVAWLARAKQKGVERIAAQVASGRLHPDVGPIAADLVRGLPRMDRQAVVNEMNKIIKAARKSSKPIFRAERQAAAAQAAALKRTEPTKFWGAGVEVIEEVSEVASQL